MVLQRFPRCRHRPRHPAKWHRLRCLVDAVNVPVVANGDVYSRADATRVMAETGCAGAMLARAIEAHPAEAKRVKLKMQNDSDRDNKLLAKLASGLHKPDGATCLPDAEAEAFVAPLPVRARPCAAARPRRPTSAARTVVRRTRLTNRRNAARRRWRSNLHWSQISMSGRSTRRTASFRPPRMRNAI